VPRLRLVHDRELVLDTLATGHRGEAPPVLTRLQVDGFKNLVDFSVDFGPFTCIAGENGVGKSNVFDAIEFLSFLADRQLMEAAQAVRGTKTASSSDIRDLFWSGDHARPMTLVA
jgi:hypothetical protein